MRSYYTVCPGSLYPTDGNKFYNNLPKKEDLLISLKCITRYLSCMEVLKPFSRLKVSKLNKPQYSSLSILYVQEVVTRFIQ